MYSPAEATTCLLVFLHGSSMMPLSLLLWPPVACAWDSECIYLAVGLCLPLKGLGRGRMRRMRNSLLAVPCEHSTSL